MQVVTQLELHLQKERDRLQSMMHHLYLTRRGVTASSSTAGTTAQPPQQQQSASGSSGPATDTALAVGPLSAQTTDKRTDELLLGTGEDATIRDSSTTATAATDGGTKRPTTADAARHEDCGSDRRPRPGDDTPTLASRAAGKAEMMARSASADVETMHKMEAKVSMFERFGSSRCGS